MTTLLTPLSMIPAESPVSSVLHAAGMLVLWVWGFWALYVLIMGFYRAKLDGRLTGMVLWLAFPWYALGWAVDLVSNLTLATVLFADLPREALVTARLKRYMAGEPGWRKRFAGWVCANLLDLFDPQGRHC